MITSANWFHQASLYACVCVSACVCKHSYTQPVRRILLILKKLANDAEVDAAEKNINE